jgi:Family of unknown function (DUF6292)
MTNMLDVAIIEEPDQNSFGRGLRGYVAEVAAALGVGLESCAIDPQSPASAYIALDQRVPRYPDRDLALLWDERHGWSAAVETHSGEDLVVLTYRGGDPLPTPSEVVRFVAAVQAGRAVGQPSPPDLSARAQTVAGSR